MPYLAVGIPRYIIVLHYSYFSLHKFCDFPTTLIHPFIVYLTCIFFKGKKATLALHSWLPLDCFVCVIRLR